MELVVLTTHFSYKKTICAPQCAPQKPVNGYK